MAVSAELKAARKNPYFMEEIPCPTCGDLVPRLEIEFNQDVARVKAACCLCQTLKWRKAF